MFFTGVGQVPIDRSGGAAAQAALDTAIRMLREGNLLGIYPEGTRSPDGASTRARPAWPGWRWRPSVPVIPVAMIGTDKVNPIGSRTWRPRRVDIRIGKPLDFSRYEGMAGDRFVERSMTDEIMYELMELSGQEYVDIYAAKAKERAAAPGRKAARGRRTAAGRATRPDARPFEHGRLTTSVREDAMRYFYDCEFIEDGGRSTWCRSAWSDEDGREFYAVSTEFDPARAGAWVRRNVLDQAAARPADPAWRSRGRIRDDLLEFLDRRAPARWSCGPGTPRTTTSRWASCGGHAGPAAGDAPVHPGSAPAVGRRGPAAAARRRRRTRTTRWPTPG